MSKFIEDVGKACSKIVGFMRYRSAKVGMDHHLLIDGTLKSNDRCKLLDTMTYGKIMAQLKRAKKIRLDNSGWQLIKISLANQLMLQNLGLLPKPEQEEKRRPGRPKKSI